MSEKHMKKFMGGRMSPSEAHRKFAWGDARCDGCGSAAVVRCVSFAPLDEMEKRAQPMLVKLAMDNEGRIPMVKFATPGNEDKGEGFVKISQAFACRDCRATLERQASKGPSWVQHEWDRGPKDAVQVQVQ